MTPTATPQGKPALSPADALELIKRGDAAEQERGARALVPRVLSAKGARSRARQLALWLDWVARHPVVSRSRHVHLFLRSKPVLLGEPRSA